MNAHAPSLPAATATPRRRNPFPMLLRREYWEHRGGFLWAPLIAGGISLLLTMVFAVVATVTARQAARDGELTIEGVTVNGLDLGLITSRMSPHELQQLASALDASLLLASSWPYIVLAFVVFFYCLGALFDDRKDRSVLFWKSLPVSDRDTVLSKVVSAAVVAPVLATAAAIATLFLFALVLSVLVAMHGGNAFQLVWAGGGPFRMAALLVAALPVYAAWALPTIGWLLLCSAWARGKPFLWAIVVPVLAGVCVWWFEVMHWFGLGAEWFWQNVVARMLLSVVPAGWMDAVRYDGVVRSPDELDALINLGTLYSTFLSPKMWIGIVAGALMIALAVRLRRWREEG